MKPDPIRKLLSAASILAGGVWIWELVSWALADSWFEYKEAVAIAFLLIGVGLMILPGAFALWFGVRLLREISESSLKGAVGSLSVLGLIVLSGLLYAAFPGVLPENIQHTVFGLIAGAVALPVYLVAVRWFLFRLAGVERSHAELISRGVLVLVAFQVWFLITETFEKFLPKRDGEEFVIEEPWNFLALVGPIVVAYGVYRILAARLLEAQKRAGGVEAAESG